MRHDVEIDNNTLIRLKKKMAEEFREQLSVGIPTTDRWCMDISAELEQVIEESWAREDVPGRVRNDDGGGLTSGGRSEISVAISLAI